MSVLDARVQAAIDHGCWASSSGSTTTSTTTAASRPGGSGSAPGCETAEKHVELGRQAEERGDRRSAGEAWARAVGALHNFGEVRVDGDAGAAATRRTGWWRRRRGRTRVALEHQSRAHRGAARRRPRGRAAPARAGGAAAAVGLDWASTRRRRSSCCLENVFSERGMVTARSTGRARARAATT